MPRRRLITAILSIASILVLVGGAFSVSAADSLCNLKFRPAVGIPGSTVFEAGKEIPLNCSSVGQYIKDLYTFGVYAGSIVAVVVLMVGGYLWLTAGGSMTQIGQAKAYIGGAISGFVLLLLSWTLLQTVNPKLTEFGPLAINDVSHVSLQQKGCNNYAPDQVPKETDVYEYVKATDSGACGGAVEGTECYCEKLKPGTYRCCFNIIKGACYGCSALICLNGPGPGSWATDDPIGPTTCADPNSTTFYVKGGPGECLVQVPKPEAPLCSSCPGFSGAVLPSYCPQCRNNPGLCSS